MKKIFTTGQAIRFYRDKKGYSQEELAALLECDYREISKYEILNVMPEPERWIKMCKTLNMPPFYYFAKQLNLESVNYVAEQKVHNYLVDNTLPETMDAIELLDLIFKERENVDNSELIGLLKKILSLSDEELAIIIKLLRLQVELLNKPELIVKKGD
jgi:transcriptional regulator with XRE-family HTH domain